MKLTVPGNILLAGEYAVLEEGGLGLACAVEPRVVVTTRAAATLRIVGNFGRGAVTWPDDSPGSDLFEVVVRHLVETRSGFRPEELPVEVTVDSSTFYTADGRKRGLGSSAAAVAALLAALDTISHARRNESDAACAARLFPESVALHRKLQGGRGSGYDVAASLFGGWGIFSGGIRPSWRPAQAGWADLSGARSSGTMDWRGLRLIDGRRPVSTVNAVVMYEKWRQEHGEAAAAFFRRSNGIVSALDSSEKMEEAATLLRNAAKHGIELGEEIGVPAIPGFPPVPGWICKAAGAGNETVICISDPGTPSTNSRDKAPGEALTVAREGLVIVRDAETGR